MALIESGPEDPRGPGRGLLRRAVLVVAGLAVGAGVYAVWSSPAEPDPPAAETAPAATSQQPVSPTPAAAPDGDPLVTAQRWLVASRTVSYEDSSATSWTERVGPLLTGRAAAENSALADAGAAGAGWEQLVQGRCRTVVSDIDAVIPPEAPHTDQQVYVQVTGTVETGCDSPDGPPIPAERSAATVEVVEIDGRWLVRERLY